MRATLKTIPVCCFTLLSLGLVAHSKAEVRTFTSPDGRTLQAEIVSATTDTVALKLANGQALSVAVTKFSPADQTYIAEWAKANPVSIKYNFFASYTKDKRDSSKSFRDNHEITTDTWVCKVKLANKSGQNLENLKVNYEIYFSQISNNQPVVRKMTGSTAIEGLKNLEETTLTTKELKLTTSKLEGGRYYLDGSRPRQKDSIEGLAIKIHHAGKPVFEWASSGVPKDKASTAEGTTGSLSR